MQYINFIRDISEDIKLGRNYFPKEDLIEYELPSLYYDYTKNHAENFTNFIQKQLDRYINWQGVAEQGYNFIPKRYLIPVKTASEMYNWTAGQIYKNPFVVYNKKVKPMVKQIFTTILLNVIDPKKPNYRLKPCILPKPIPQIHY